MNMALASLLGLIWYFSDTHATIPSNDYEYSLQRDWLLKNEMKSTGNHIKLSKVGGSYIIEGLRLGSGL